MPEYIQAPEDGTYRLGRGNFLVRKGGRMPARAEFIPKASRAPKLSADPIDGETEEPVRIQTEDLPKWYESYRERAAKNGEPIHAKYVGETETAFKERIGSLEETGSDDDQETAETPDGETAGKESAPTENAQSGPSETTNEGAGPTETT